MTILLTGASGFVGKAILHSAAFRGIEIRPVYRSVDSAQGYPEAALVAEIDGAVNWSKALQGIDIVIHAAARTHCMSGETLDLSAEYQRVNTQGSLNLARQAAAIGVKRFIFISSVKVNGEFSEPGRPLNTTDAPAPADAYALSKAEAEAGLTQIAQETGMEVTIIRPPLIYGPGVKGNFLSLVNLVRRGFPLPLGCVTRNRRSLVGLDNLVDLIFVCSSHPNAANQIFLISDGEDLSTTELLRRIGKALGRPARLLWAPSTLIAFGAALVGRKVLSQRLLGSLQVDIKKTSQLLDWRPPVTVDEGLRRALE